MARLIYVLFLIGLCSLAAIVGWVNDALKEYTDNKFYRFLTIVVLFFSLFILFGIAYESTIQDYVNTNW